MERIKRIASFTKESKIVADIGCDHAYCLFYAVKKFGVQKGYACDIALGPLANARNTIEQENLNEFIIPIQSDGFDAVPNDFDTAILSGMGGALIVKLLERGFSKIQGKKLIISPNKETYRVREFLFAHHFQIVEEDAFFDQDKYYELMVAVPGSRKYDVYDTMYGPLLRRSRTEAYLNYYLFQKNILEGALKQMAAGPRKDAKRMKLYEISDILKAQRMEKYFINHTKNYYRCYFVDDTKRPTIFVAPGGAYQYTSIRESEPVAYTFLKLGYHVVIINYRQTLEDAYPLPGQYLAWAIDEASLDKRIGKRIGLGFSAGGHCILDVCLHSKDYQVKYPLELLGLGYPVISTSSECIHEGSFNNLLQGNKEKLKDVSLETQVAKENAIDLFLWGTITDASVPVKNSLRLVEAYYAIDANVEYHLFPFGGHGLSVADENSSEEDPDKKNPYLARWVDFFDRWIRYKLNK